MKDKIIYSPIFFLTLFFVYSCNTVGTAEFDAIAIPEDENQVDMTPVDYSFFGPVSFSHKTDSTVMIYWTPHAEAVSYDIFDLGSGTQVFLTNVLGQSSSQFTLTGLIPGALYKIRLKMRDSVGRYDININEISFTMNPAPDMPSSLTVTAPGVSGINSAITVQVGGVKDGDTVKLFSNDSCTNFITSGIASGPTIDLNVNNLSAGTNNFYATSSNIVPSSSACSSTAASYNKLQCPDGYIPIVGNPVLGVSDFCVMRWEAKCATTIAGTSICSPSTGTPGGSKVAVSVASGTPWISIISTDSFSACRNLNAINGVSNKYDLISNAEWMTIARSIEATASNWVGGVNTGYISRGHSDSSPNSNCDGTVVNVQTDCTTLGTDATQKRTHTLDNGEVIWDIAGNVWEWVDWVKETPNTTFTTVAHATKAYVNVDGAPVYGWREFASLDRNINNGDVMNILTWQPNNPALNSTHGIGSYHSSTSGGAAVRGGDRYLGSPSGAFALAFGTTAIIGRESAPIGFRCVYRP